MHVYAREWTMMNSTCSKSLSLSVIRISSRISMCRMMRSFILVSLALVCLAGVCVAGLPAPRHHHQHQHHQATSRLSDLPTSCEGTQNNLPVIDFDAAGNAKLVKSVENGTLWTVTPENATNPLLVMHIYGDSYSQGYAYGQLLTDQILDMLPKLYAWAQQEYHIDRATMDVLLDMTRNTTKGYTPKWHFDFLQGLSDGSAGAISYVQIWRIAMIPELIKAACSIVGAWGQATADGGLLQLRALDWGPTSPLPQYALLTTFHQTDGSYTYTTLGWAGLYGALTGWSSSNLAVGEKVWASYKKLQNIYGYPWTFMIQDMLRFDSDVDAALSRVATGTRTCAIWLGLGQGARPNPRDPSVTLPANFKLVGDSFEEVHIYNPENGPVYPNHDYFPDLLFADKHVQPSGHACMNDLMHWGYGKFSAKDIFQTVTALQQTGDMHIAVMDFDAATLHVANANAPPTYSPAYNNGFVKFDMKTLWNAQPKY